MFINDGYKVKSSKGKDGNIEYILMEKLHEGRWKQVDSITTDKYEVAYLHFSKRVRLDKNK